MPSRSSFFFILLAACSLTGQTAAPTLVRAGSKGRAVLPPGLKWAYGLRGQPLFPEIPMQVLVNSDHHITASEDVTGLAESVVAAGVPPFTVSIGLADSTYATTAAGIIAQADAALMTAKREGRDRLIIAAKPDHAVGEAFWAAG